MIIMVHSECKNIFFQIHMSNHANDNQKFGEKVNNMIITNYDYKCAILDSISKIYTMYIDMYFPGYYCQYTLQAYTVDMFINPSFFRLRT